MMRDVLRNREYQNELSDKDNASAFFPKFVRLVG
jgi:hypothetical protein